MKNFINWERESLFKYDIKQKKVYWEAIHTLWSEKDVFNFFENWIRNTKYEDELGNFEWNRSILLQEIIKQSDDFIQLNSCKGWKSYQIDFLNNQIKENIISMILFMNHKLLYHEIRRWFTLNEIYKSEFDEETLKLIHEITSQSDVEWILRICWKSLYNLCDDPWKWCILYSDEDIFYFWDQPFHFRANRNEWDWNNFQTFFQRIWSSLYFPISKNIAILIELSIITDMHRDMIVNITSEWMRVSDYEFHIDKKQWKIPSDSFLWTIKYRIFSNCDRYIAWSDKQYLESIVSWYSDIYKQYYHQDMISYIINITLPQLLEKYFSGLLRT